MLTIHIRIHIQKKKTAMGFKLGMPEYISGEKDWVYGILVRGHHVMAGDRISVEDKLIIQVGNGKRDVSDSVDYVDPTSPDIEENNGDADGFEVVSGSEATEPEHSESNKTTP